MEVTEYMRLLAEVDGRLLDLTNSDPQAAAPYLDKAGAVFIASPAHVETVANFRSTGKPERWTRGGKTVDETDLPDGWDLPNGRRLQRPGGKENPHKQAGKGKPEVKAQWRLSTPQT